MFLWRRSTTEQAVLYFFTVKLYKSCITRRVYVLLERRVKRMRLLQPSKVRFFWEKEREKTPRDSRIVRRSLLYCIHVVTARISEKKICNDKMSLWPSESGGPRGESIENAFSLFFPLFSYSRERKHCVVFLSRNAVQTATCSTLIHEHQWGNIWERSTRVFLSHLDSWLYVP